MASITKYFDKSSSKKRELSEQSNNGDEPKKQREGSQDLTDGWDDIFLEGLTSPENSAALVNFLKKLEVMIKNVADTTESTRSSQIKGEQHLVEMNQSISTINEKLIELEKKLKEKDEIIDELQGNVKELSKTVDYLNVQIDKQEQYSRRNCLLLHNVGERENEDTDQLVIDTRNDNMNEKISINDIDRTHRLGPVKSEENRKRPIIVKFSRYYVKNKIFRNKKQLKGKNFSITESLTKRRMGELTKARAEHGFKNVWTNDGKILFKNETSKKVKVFYD